MTAKIITHAEYFALVVSDDDSCAVIVTSGAQGPPGKNGLDGMDISAEPSNQISKKPDGLYVPPTSWILKEW